MSKLLKQFESLKKEDASCIYIFRVGIFYNILNEDAKIIHEKLGLKIIDLGPSIFKCGFPISQRDKYITLLNKMEIKYKIIDNLPNSNLNEYSNNIEIGKILKKIKELNMNSITPLQAFNTLNEIQQKIRNI